MDDEDLGQDMDPEERASLLRQTADYWFALAPVPVAATYVDDPKDLDEKIFTVSLSLEPVNLDPVRFGEMLMWVVTNVAALLYDMADSIDPEHPSRRPPPKSRTTS